MPVTGNFLIGLSPTFVVAFLCFTLINVSVVDGKICQDMDIRNKPYHLDRLSNCSIIIGSLSIVLIEKSVDVDFSNYTFPELREITGYLLFFRIFGLKTLHDLFPNLVVIRGERLIRNYALIVYELPALSELGLTSLIKIQRGYVMIRYCPVLCYVHTINFEAITQYKMPGGLGNYLDYESSNDCPTACPETCTSNYCWNNKQCQVFDTGKSTILPNVTCHEECLGDCVNETANGCIVCKHLRVMATGTCVEQCPKDLYAYSSFCVDANYCIKMGKKPILKECRHSCPLIISEGAVKVSSIEQCAKECPGVEIDSLATSDLLRGCQIIKGDMYVRLTSGVYNTMEILERNLGDIEEIEGILKVHRSPAITSLAFFRSLRIIRGDKNGKYTFVLMSNENLQELWNFNEKKNFELLRGNLLVHFNSKLCLKQIHELQKLLKTNTSADFISTESNGYEQTCSARPVSAWSKVISSSEVEIIWSRINVSETEKVVGYEISYIVSADKNITRIGIDTCVGYGWETHFVLNITDDPLTNTHSAIIRDLMPFTQYAFYVKTQVVLKIHEEEKLGVSQGLSNIMYFKTNPEAPSYPVVDTHKKTNTTITLVWQPMFDNEWIENYKCDVFIHPDEHKILDARNYCDNPRVDAHVTIGTEVNPNSVYQSCSAEFEDWQIANPDSVDPEYEWRIHRRAQCAQRHSRRVREESQSEIMQYVKRHEIINSCGKEDEGCDDMSRIPRQIHSLLPDDGVDRFRNTSSDLGIRHVRSYQFPYYQLNATFDGFLPYTLYVFQFFACNQINCSSYYFYYDRTESSIYADLIPSLHITTEPNDRRVLHLDFSEPPTPNGITVAFEIEKHYLENSNITIYCVTRKDHYANGKRYTFRNLLYGRYSFRVRSVSLAMAGAFTEHQFITISEPLIEETNVFLMAFCIGMVFGGLIVSLICCYWPKRLQSRVHDVRSSREVLVTNAECDEEGTEMIDFSRPALSRIEEIPALALGDELSSINIQGHSSRSGQGQSSKSGDSFSVEVF